MKQYGIERLLKSFRRLAQGEGKRPSRLPRQPLRFERLEDRLAPVVTNWIQSVSGDWNTASNWSSGVPTAADDAIISVTGATPFTVTRNGDAAVKTLFVNDPDVTLNLNSGTLTAAETVTFALGKVVLNGYTLTGAAATFNNNLTGANLLTVRGASAISTAGFLQNGAIHLASSGTATTLTVSGGFTNNGSILLQQVAGNGGTTILALTSGTLTNTGTLTVNQGTLNPGTGAFYALRTDLVNNGTVNLNADTRLDKANTVATNSAAWTIAATKALTFPNSNMVFHQDGGTLNIAGAFTMTNTDTFNFNGGAMTGPALLDSVALNLSPAATGPASFLVRGMGGTLSGDVKAGQSLFLNSVGAGVTLTAATGFTNAGTIRLEQTAGNGGTTILALTSGTLTNTGTLTVNQGTLNPGTGAFYALRTDLANTGTVNFNGSTRLDRASTVAANNATWNIAEGRSLTVPQNGTFNQNAGTLSSAGAFSVTGGTFNQNGGTLDIAGAFSQNNGAFNFNADAITGTLLLDSVALNLGPAATSPASFILRGTGGTLSGNVKAGQSLFLNSVGAAVSVTAASGFSNAGAIRLEQTAGNAGTTILALTSGTLTNTGTLTVNQGTLNPSTGAFYALRTDLANTGTVNLNGTTRLDKVNTVATNGAAWTIAAGRTLSFGQPGTFNQNGGTLDIAGAFPLSSDTLNFNGGTITGTPLLDNSALNLGPAATSPASFILRGTGGTLSGDVKAGQSLFLNSVGAGVTLIAATGFTNAGTIRLEQTAGNGGTTILALTSGTLTNTGTLTVNQGTLNPGTGAFYALRTNLVNNGTVNLNADTRLDKLNAAATNSAAWTIAAGRTLTFGQAGTFNQNGGTLDIIGAFALNGDTFNFNGGTLTGEPLLTSSALNLGVGTTAAAFRSRLLSTLSGNVNAGQTITIESTGASASRLTAAVGFSNAGTIVLISQTASGRATLEVLSGTLINAPTGVINSVPGVAGGGRFLTTELDNRGIINFDSATTVSRTDTQHRNSGTFNVRAIVTMHALTTSGTVAIGLDSGIDLSSNYVQTAGTTTFNNGGIRSPLVDLQGGLLTGSGIVLGNVRNAARIDVGGNGVVGFLGIAGNYTQTATGVLHLDLGGVDLATQYDFLFITGSATLAGTLTINLINGFEPEPELFFTPLVATTMEGEFATVNGLVYAGSTRTFVPFTADGVFVLFTQTL